MRLVLRIGGSVLIPSDIDEQVLQIFVREITAVQENHDVYVVVGGGHTA